jgi:hypothetical protein
MASFRGVGSLHLISFLALETVRPVKPMSSKVRHGAGGFLVCVAGVAHMAVQFDKIPPPWSASLHVAIVCFRPCCSSQDSTVWQISRHVTALPQYSLAAAHSLAVWSQRLLVAWSVSTSGSPMLWRARSHRIWALANHTLACENSSTHSGHALEPSAVALLPMFVPQQSHISFGGMARMASVHVGQHECQVPQAVQVPASPLVGRMPQRSHDFSWCVACGPPLRHGPHRTVLSALR